MKHKPALISTRSPHFYEEPSGRGLGGGPAKVGWGDGRVDTEEHVPS